MIILGLVHIDLKFSAEEAGVVGAAVDMGIGFHVVVHIAVDVLLPECACAALEGVAVVEHAFGSLGCIGVPSAADEDSGQVLAIVEHVGDVGDVVSVERREVEVGEVGASAEEALHVGDLAGDEVLESGD